MKNILLISICLIAASCKSTYYQLVTLESSNEDLMANNMIFKDSLITISYDFYSPSGLIEYTIRNNYEKPVYIDWKNSMIIKSDQGQFVYWKDVSTLNGKTSGYEVQWNSWLSTNRGSLKGTISTPERITILPPNMEVTVSKYVISNNQFETETEEAQVSEHETNYYDTDKKQEVRIYEYDKEETPTTFRVYLTMALSEDFDEPLYYDFDFWISEIMEMSGKQLVGSDKPEHPKHTPDNPDYHPYREKNRFFIRH